MFEWVDKEGLSARRVLERLNEMKVPPHKGGAGWAKSSVLRILRSETYTGVWHYNKYESCEPKNTGKQRGYKRLLKCSLRRRDKSEWLPITLPDHLRIIERARWERVQRQLDRNIVLSTRNAKHDYLLKGLVKCGGCNSRYVGDPCHGKFYYRCLARCKKYPTVREELLDSAVWEAVREAILNPSVIADQLVRLRHRRAEDAEQAKSKHQEIEELSLGLQKEEERILEAYRKNILSPTQLGRELEKLQARKSLLESRSSNRSDGTKKDEGGAVSRSLVDYCKIAAERLGAFNRSEQQQFLRTLVNEIVFEGTQVRIRGVIPVSEAGLQLHIDSSAGSTELAASGGRIEDKALYRSGRSSGLIENIRGYPNARNSVGDISFELLKDMSETPLPLHLQLNSGYLSRLVQQHPAVSLRELCDVVLRESGITISPQTLCKLLLRAGLTCKVRCQIAARSSLPLAA